MGAEATIEAQEVESGHSRPDTDRQSSRKPSAIRDCLLAVFPAIPYCIDLIEGPYLTTNERVVKAFRPKS